MRWGIAGCVVAALLTLGVAAFPAISTASDSGADSRRIALVIGNSHYASSPLTNPESDAQLIAATLRQLNFEVRLLTNGSQVDMKRAIQAFGAALESGGPSAVGLFYYAGHGVQIDGRNFLIPVGARIERGVDVEIEAVSADWVLEEMRFARNRLNFVILDACRNNPFAATGRGGDRGLARMDAPAGVLIAYSTAPGEVAADGEGRNSPYSLALAQAMRETDGPAELMFKQARVAVRQATGDRQTPWESSSLTGDFRFAAHPAVARSGPGTGVMVASAVPSPPKAAPVAAAPAAASPGGAEADSFLSAPPDFLSAPLCQHAIGDWKFERDNIHGRVRFDEKATGLAKLTDDAPTVPLKWRCDAVTRAFVIEFKGGEVHKVTIDGSEKLLFGYDPKGVPIIYSR